MVGQRDGQGDHCQRQERRDPAQRVVADAEVGDDGPDEIQHEPGRGRDTECGKGEPGEQSERSGAHQGAQHDHPGLRHPDHLGRRGRNGMTDIVHPATHAGRGGGHQGEGGVQSKHDTPRFPPESLAAAPPTMERRAVGPRVIVSVTTSTDPDGER